MKRRIERIKPIQLKGTIYELILILFYTTIKVNFDVNYRQFKEYILFELEECAGALATQNKISYSLPKLQFIIEH